MDDETTDVLNHLRESEESILGILMLINLSMGMHDDLPIAEALASHREEEDDYAALRLVLTYFEFGGRLISEGVEHGLFEPDEKDTWRSDHSEAFEHMLGASIRGAAYEEGGPRLVSSSFEIEMGEFDEEELFERLVHGGVTRDEFYTYVSRCDVKRLQDALIEHDTDVEIVNPDSNVPIDWIGPDDDALTQYIGDGFPGGS